jgi:hypothetical protein
MATQLEFDEKYLALLSKPWQKFFKKFTEIDEVPNSEWKPVHQVAHFSRRYKDHYGKRFAFSVRGAPSRCPEIYMIKRISAMLGTTNQMTIRNYVDWVFDNKIIKNDKKIRALGFLANPQYGNEFHLAMSAAKKIDRTTELPDTYKTIAEQLDVPVNTFGDLAFAKGALDNDPTNESVEVYHQLFRELYRVGFEFSMIKDLK